MYLKYTRPTLFLVAILIVGYLLRPPGTMVFDQPYSTIVNDAEGHLLSAHIAADEQWRLPIIDSVPERFETAILDYEDKRYFHHLGIDFIALARAITDNIKQGRVVSGASTITMQLARLSYGPTQRTYPQKIKEMLLALRYEIWHSKDEILQWYASIAPYGGNVVGLRTAAWRYYGKNPDQLSWAEVATLAVLPNAPSLIHVNKNRGLLNLKRNKLLQSLLIHEQIDTITYELSLEEELPNKLYQLPRQAPHLLSSLPKLSTNAKINIRREIQTSAQQVLDQYHKEWSQNDIQNGAVLILDTNTGDVISYIGNVSQTKHEGDVDMILASRSSGSILKPFLYAAMIDEGMIGPKSIIKDVPLYISGFSPSNYNGEYSGYIPANEALQRSLNIPFVLLLREYGIDIFISKLKSIGINTLNQGANYYGLSLILGGGEVNLWELAQAYRNLAQCAMGNNDTYSAGSAYVTLDALKELKRPNDEGDWERYESTIPIAWKTGTSYGHRDAWAVGVTPEITIATWVGNADGEGRNGIIGTKLAGKLLFGIINNVNLNRNWFTPPYTHMKWNHICQQSGDLASQNCNVIDTVLSPIIHQTRKICKYHKRIIVETNSEKRVTEDCVNSFQTKSKTYFNIDPIAASHYKVSHPSYTPIPSILTTCKGTDNLANIEIKYPSAGDKIYIPNDLNQTRQALVIEAAHQQPNAQIYWYLDDAYIGNSIEWHTMSVTPPMGTHTITLVDQNGDQVSRQFEIVGDN